MIKNKEDEIGDYKFASEATGIKLGTLYSLVNRKRIPHFKLNRRLIRFSKNDLDTWVRKNKVEVKTKKRGHK